MRIILVFIMTVFSCQSLYAGCWGWPFHKTLPVEGRITDATTGKPIENVLIEVRWGKIKPVLVDTSYPAFAIRALVTDKEGKYRIPGKISFHFVPLLIIGSAFYDMSISIFHPLYEGSIKQRSIHWCEDGKWVYKILDDSTQKHRTLEKKDGKIQLDIQLLSLEEKYKKPEDNFELSSEILSHGNGGYFLTLKNRGIAFDIKSVFLEWERLGSRFPQEIHFNQLTRRIKNTQDRILKVIKNEK